MSAASDPASPIPSGAKFFTSIPELLMIPELVFGGLVWILVASARVSLASVQGWVMFVSVFCFVITALLLILYLIGVQKRSSGWTAVDVFYHFIAAMFYLSIAVLEATITRFNFFPVRDFLPKVYKLNISASVFVFVATLMYTIHAVLSILRWKS